MALKSRWAKLQQREYRQGQQKYRATGSYFGYFSVPEFDVTNKIANRLAGINGPILDVGCGLLPMPNYLKDCHQPFGVDPYQGQRRRFPFAQAIGEALPFRDNYFSAVLLMSVIDHVIEPERTMAEISRVMACSGLLYVWYANHKIDTHHLRGIDRTAILGMTERLFRPVENVIYQGNRAIGYPRTEMIVFCKNENC